MPLEAEPPRASMKRQQPTKTPWLEETLNIAQLWRAVIFFNWLGWKGNGEKGKKHISFNDISFQLYTN